MSVVSSWLSRQRRSPRPGRRSREPASPARKSQTSSSRAFSFQRLGRPTCRHCCRSKRFCFSTNPRAPARTAVPVRVEPASAFVDDVLDTTTSGCLCEAYQFSPSDRNFESDLIVVQVRHGEVRVATDAECRPLASRRRRACSRRPATALRPRERHATVPALDWYWGSAGMLSP